MRLKKGLLILFAVLVVLALAVYIMSKNEDKAGEDDDLNEEKIIDLLINDVKAVTVVNGSETYVVEREKAGEDIWILTTPEDFNYESSEVRSIVYNIYSITANRLVDEAATDLAQYGLDKPITVKVETNAGAEYTLEIGNKTPSSDDRYARLKGSPKVYTIGSYVASKLVFERDALRSKTIFTSDAEEISKVVMYKNGSKTMEAAKDSNDSWQISYPVIARADADSIGLVLESIDIISAVDFVKADSEPEKDFGLDNPKYAIEFEAETEKGTLYLGREESSVFYAKKSGSDDIFTVYSDYLDFVDKPIKEFVDGFVFLVNIDEVSAIDVSMDGYALDIEMETGSEEANDDKFYVNGRDASMVDETDRQPFRKYYEGLIAIRQSDVIPDAVPVGEAEITITFTLKSEPGVMKIEYISKDDFNYYVNKNGKYSGLIASKSEFDKEGGLRQKYSELMEWLNKR